MFIKLVEDISEKNNFRSIEFYSTAHTSEAVFIIGGYYTKDIIAEFKDNEWRRLEKFLNQGRYGHGSVTIGGQTMIIGGWTNGGR